MSIVNPAQRAGPNENNILARDGLSLLSTTEAARPGLIVFEHLYRALRTRLTSGMPFGQCSRMFQCNHIKGFEFQKASMMPVENEPNSRPVEVLRRFMGL